MPQKYTVEVDDHGNRRWYNDQGQLHRTDGPAYERADGSCSWWQNGQRHRVDGPACEWADGSCSWYLNGKREWYLNGQRHRTDGPAREWADGSREWWLNGELLSEQEHQARTQVKPTCDGRVVEIDGHKYQLTAL